MQPNVTINNYSDSDSSQEVRLQDLSEHQQARIVSESNSQEACLQTIRDYAATCVGVSGHFSDC